MEVHTASQTRTRSFYGGSGANPSVNNAIDFITIASTGDAMILVIYQGVVMPWSLSDSHGGLGGY